MVSRILWVVAGLAAFCVGCPFFMWVGDHFPVFSHNLWEMIGSFSSMVGVYASGGAGLVMVIYGLAGRPSSSG